MIRIMERKELYKKLLPTDRIAIEVCSLGMVMAKEIIQQVGAEVVLLNPSQIALIYRSVKKNDKEDALKLARLVKKYKNEELPKVELPTEHEENLRQILTEIRQLKNDRTKEINRLHAIFVECGITEIKKKDLTVPILLRRVRHLAKRKHIFRSIYIWQFVLHLTALATWDIW